MPQRNKAICRTDRMHPIVIAALVATAVVWGCASILAVCVIHFICDPHRERILQGDLAYGALH